MIYRSWLVVPANNEKRLGRAADAGADAVVVDLVESDPLASRTAARQRAAEWLEAHGRSGADGASARWVRINPLDNGAEWRQDLLAVVNAAPDGVILPRAAGPEAVRQLAADLYEIEQRAQVPANSTRIIPMVGDTAQAALTIGQYVQSGHQRIAGMGWSPAELALGIGATRMRGEDGVLAETFRFVRAQALLTAHACGFPAIDTMPDGAAEGSDIEQAARTARGDGFSAMFAYHAEQVAAINEVFTPSDAELQQARAIVAALDSKPAGTSLDYGGRVIGGAHLKLARRTLGLESAGAQETAQAPSILRPA